MSKEDIVKYNRVVHTHLPQLQPKQMIFEEIDFGYEKDSLNLI